jgi:hypothetical protein
MTHDPKATVYVTTNDLVERHSSNRKNGTVEMIDWSWHVIMSGRLELEGRDRGTRSSIRLCCATCNRSLLRSKFLAKGSRGILPGLCFSMYSHDGGMHCDSTCLLHNYLVCPTTPPASVWSFVMLLKTWNKRRVCRRHYPRSPCGYVRGSYVSVA